MVLSPTQVDNSGADFHTVQHGKCFLSALVFDVFAEAEAAGVQLTRFLNQMEGSEPAVSLEKIFDLVFAVLFRETANEQFATTVIYLSGDDA